MTAGPRVSVAVEGESDTGMVGTLLAHVGISLARPCLVKRGVTNLDRLIPGLSRTSINNPWVVFRDSDGRCPVELRTALIGSRPHDGGFERCWQTPRISQIISKYPCRRFPGPPTNCLTPNGNCSACAGHPVRVGYVMRWFAPTARPGCSTRADSTNSPLNAGTLSRHGSAVPVFTARS